jgi:hypothetical protein
MFKYLTCAILLSLGVVSLLEARGGYGGRGGFAEGPRVAGNPAAFQYQRTPTLSRANPYSYGGYGYGGTTTVVEPGYYTPPPQQGNPAAYAPN